MGLYVSIQFAIAAMLALVGTNAQARLSRGRLLADEDPLVAEAGRLWTPGPRWLAAPTYRRRREAVEVRLREDPERAKRYDRLRTELFAWNAIETSVALAAAASLVSIVAAIVD
jgi:hypothetical protein